MKRFSVPAILVALCFSALLVGPGPAEAIIFGVHSNEAMAQPEATRAAQAGVQEIRAPIFWSQIQPGGPEAPFDFASSGYDQYVRVLARSNIKVFPVLIGRPHWMPGADQDYPVDDAGREYFARYAEALAKRYGRGGSFWNEVKTQNRKRKVRAKKWNKQHPKLAKTSPQVAVTTPVKPMTAYEIWNEPNRATYSPAGAEPVHYAALLMHASPRIKAIDPRALIVVAGMDQAGSNKEGRSFDFFMKGFYRADPSIRSAYDVIALHPYATNRVETVNSIASQVQTINNYGDTGRRVWITEVGIGLAPGEGLAVTSSAQSQANYLTDVFNWLNIYGPSLNIDHVFWYSFEDLANCGSAWACTAGLFADKAVTPKPVFNSFVVFTGGS